jgi:hypothetical protein|tara:strand:- start:284 stop:775 length:492 start_codon:yes stop_codon:yes gene_type:complete
MATTNAATSFLENRLLRYIFKNNDATFNSPGDNIYVGLATAVSNFNDGTGTTSTGESGTPSITEATFGDYGRVNVTAANWDITNQDADTQKITNGANINFDPSTGTDNTITHVFITTASGTTALDTLGAGGNVLFIGELDVHKTIQTGDIFRINQGNLSIELK